MDRQRIKGIALGILIAFAGAAFAKSFGTFTPATGILVGNANSSVTTAATSTNVAGLWSGTCDATTFLRGDGACATAGGATSGTFTATWETACTTSPTQTFKYVVSGTVVTLTATQTVTCTSDSTTFTASAALPLAIRPDTNLRVYGATFVNNGTADLEAGCIRLETDGSMTLMRTTTSPCNATAWTNSGTKTWEIAVGGVGYGPSTYVYDMDLVP